MTETIDMTVFESFFEQYHFNTPPQRIELESMLRENVKQECLEFEQADRMEVESDCELVIAEARRRVAA
jgi:hypothetical protein